MLILAELNVASFTFMGAVLLISGILLFQSNRYFSRQTKRRSFSETLHEPKKESESVRALPHEGERWEVQMRELARELSARLDSKMGALEQLIVEADRAAARLEQASSVARHGQQGEASGIDVSELAVGAAAGTPARAGAASGYQERYEEIYLLSDYGYPPEEIAHRVGSPVGEVELILGLRKKRV